MNKYIIFIATVMLCLGCTINQPKEFSEKALQEKLLTLKGNNITFKKIISNYKGKKVLIDIWASWCGDCIKALPKVKQLQQDFPNVVFLFLSVDKNKNSWKKAIKRFDIRGEHYNLPKGQKDGDFVDFINLWWIPRYMIIDENGKIDLYKATNALDNKILYNLKKTL